MKPTKRFYPLGCALILSLLAVFSPPANAQTDDSAFLKKAYAANGAEMPYRLYVPPSYDKKAKFPLVLWLHGSAGRGTDNERQISAGNLLGSHVWTKPENQAKFPAFVLAPQCAPDEGWDQFIGQPLGEKPGKQLQLALDILRAVEKEYSIDPDRVFVAGQSMGGEGTWAALYHKPEIFAAGIPLCGYLAQEDAARVAHKTVWIFQGEADETVPVAMAREFVTALKAAGGTPRYTEYPGVGHFVWEKAFAEPEIVDWLAKQRRAK